MKKYLLSLLFIVTATITFTSCNQNASNDLPKMVKITGVDIGATDVNPKTVQFFDIKFNKPMDKNYKGFVYYNYSEVLGSYWINDFTFRFEISAKYNQYFKIVINDSTYQNKDWNPEKEFWRDTEGNLLNETIISFNTIPYPQRDPMTHEIDLTDSTKIRLNNAKNFKLNNVSYDENGKITETNITQQYPIQIRNVLNHELLRKGDVLKLKYCVKSLEDLSKVKISLIDVGLNGSQFVQISSNNHTPLAVDYKLGDSFTNEVTFNITEDAENPCINLYAKLEEIQETINIELIQQ